MDRREFLKGTAAAGGLMWGSALQANQGQSVAPSHATARSHGGQRDGAGPGGLHGHEGAPLRRV